MREERREEQEIDLLELLMLLLRRWKLLLLGLIAGGVVAGGFTYMKTPVYESKSMLYVLSKTTSITSVADLQLGSELSADFVVIATSKPVLDTAIEQMKENTGVILTREQVLSMTTVSNKSDTRVLEITATSEDPEVACELANAMTEASAAQMASIMKSDPPTTVELAEVATEPVDNGLTKYTAMGALIGFLIIAVLVIIPYLANDKIKTAEDVEKYLGTGVLGEIPFDKVQARSRKTRKQ